MNPEFPTTLDSANQLLPARTSKRPSSAIPQSPINLLKRFPKQVGVGGGTLYRGSWKKDPSRRIPSSWGGAPMKLRKSE